MKRKPWVALMLSIISAPLGYVYAGFPKKGVIISVLILLLLPTSIVLTKIKLSITVLASLLLFILILSVVILVDVYRSAKRQPDEYRLKLYNKWWIYILIYAVYGFVIFPFAQNYTKENIIQSYKIPSYSMAPTLLAGDQFFVDKLSYKTQAISRRDVIVFPLPKNPKIDYVKRVIGLPGDEIEIIDKQVYINGIQQNEKFIIHTDSNSYPQTISSRDNFGPIKIPEYSVFVLGDNRDNSYDSRFWGFVPQDTIKGKIVNTYWSWDKNHSQARWERIGLKIE